MIARMLAALVPLMLSAGVALAHCHDASDPCRTDGGDYRIALPEKPAPGAPVVVFLHGFGGNGNGAMNNRRLSDPFLERGYAVIAPDGLRRGGSGPQSWNFFPGWQGRDETAFLKSVVTDAADRYGTSADKVLLAGFSAGAFMVNYLACSTPDAFAAYAPVSGGFWEPMPESCAGPVKLFHTHGWSDSTVPLEGRRLRHGEFQQGDIFAGLSIWRAANGCADEKPSGFSRTGNFMRRKWADCAPGSALEMALFPGGHRVPAGWADMVLDWFEDLSVTN